MLDYIKEKMDIPIRHVLTIWNVLGYVVSFAMRVNLSVALVEMMNISPMDGMGNDASSPLACPELFTALKSNTSYPNTELSGEFNWDRKTQTWLLGAFYYGIVAGYIPGGILAEKWSAKWTAGLGIFISSLMTLLSPISAKFGATVFFVTRLVSGVAQGAHFPSMNTMIGRWIPKTERSSFLAWIYAGASFGNIIGFALSGVLCKYSFLGGWPSAFYVFGVLGCVWFVFWTWLIHEWPEDHPNISPSELAYIANNKANLKKPPIPWISILTSIPVWAITIANFGQSWSLYTLMSLMPTYLAKVLHFNIGENGVLTSLPYILLIITSLISGSVADKMTRSEKLSLTNIRKLFNSLGLFGAGLFILLVPLVGCRPYLSVAILCLSLGCLGFVSAGWAVIHVDMSPQFAGILAAILGAFSMCAGFLGPYVAGQITTNGETLYNWGIVFFISAGISFGSGIFFDLFATAELQPWNSPLQHRETEEHIEVKNIPEENKDQSSMPE